MEFGVEGGEELESFRGVAPSLRVVSDRGACGEVLVESGGGDGNAIFEGLQGYVISYSVIIAYFTLFEGLTRGRTLGKLITGTYAVGMDAKPVTMKQAFQRSLCRIVPFEPFSGFGTPWHDKWTATTVVKGKP